MVLLIVTNKLTTKYAYYNSTLQLTMSMYNILILVLTNYVQVSLAHNLYIYIYINKETLEKVQLNFKFEV